jgi:hypothetical protein
MGDDVFKKRVPTAAAKKVRDHNKRARGCDSIPRFGDEDGNPLTRDCLGPDAFSAVERLRNRTHL